MIPVTPLILLPQFYNVSPPAFVSLSMAGSSPYTLLASKGGLLLETASVFKRGSPLYSSPTANKGSLDY